MGKILGLDVGIGSLGWAVIDRDARRIDDLGVRIFESGEEGASKAADRASQVRRGYRSTKRLNKRRRQRKLRLKQYLESNNIISIDEINDWYRTKGNNPDVWRFRSEGLTRKLEPCELASVLINLANYRGYQDFYEDSSDEDSGKLSEAKNRINKIYEEKKSQYRTIGQMIYEDESFRNKNNGKIIIRNRAVVNKDGKKETDYKYLIDRRYLRDELKTLLSCQREFGYEQLTDDVIDTISCIIFVQRDFEDGPGPKKGVNDDRREAMMASLKGHQTYSGFDDLIGNCPFYPDELRGHKNSQLYDMYVMINSLSQLSFTCDGKEIPFPENLIYELRQVLFENNGVITKKLLETICKKQDIEVVIPSELSKKKNLIKGAYIQFLSDPEYFPEHLIRSFKEEDFDDPNSLSSRIGYILAKYATPRRRQEELSKVLPDEDESLINRIKLFKSGGGANVSFKYMKEAVEAYIKGLRYGDFQAKFNKEHPEEDKREYLYPNGKIKPISDPDMVRNPVVYRSLNETRKVINAIMGKYKDIDVINVEVAKDVGKSFEQRKETASYQRKNEEANEQTRAELIQKLMAEGHSVMLSDKLMDRYVLWKSQNCKCMYSGKDISFAELVNGTIVQVDHIIPQSIVLDETLNNKVLVLTEENQKKGNDVPLKYMYEDQAKEFKNRVSYLNRKGFISRTKKEYLLLPYLDDEVIRGFVDRNINDTRIISKYIADYLKKAYKNDIKVNVIKGAVTSRFRKRWLGSKWKIFDYVPSIYGLEKKTRDLHYYHHAIDAVVVANLERSYIELAQDFVKLNSIKKDINYHMKHDNARTVDNLQRDYEDERGKTVDKMFKTYGFNREYTLALLDSGYVPSICDNLRQEVEIRVPLQIDFDARAYTDMETDYYELKQLLNGVRYNLKDCDIVGPDKVIDDDTLEQINARISNVDPKVAGLNYKAQIVYVDKPVDEAVDPDKIRKELDSYTKRLTQRDIKDYIQGIRMLSEEEYSERVHEYYEDQAFADQIELPYVSFKINRKYRGSMVTSDNPISLYKTDFNTYKELEEDMKTNIKCPYYVRFNSGIGELNNFTIYAANKYYCVEIYKDSKGKYQMRGIRFVDVHKNKETGSLVLNRPLPMGCAHYMYLFKNEYIRIPQKGKRHSAVFGAYRNVKNNYRNECRIRLFSNEEYIVNVAGACRVIEMSILGHIIGERQCGDQSLFITENG
ncbi:MAG: type II CRISPR RNA-guided endonuclease Cas9 [Clostridiales bacterium]|nr:type II CRISPR RNA-guided endonuclease Cas9 [Clostridiales bacterium]